MKTKEKYLVGTAIVIMAFLFAWIYFPNDRTPASSPPLTFSAPSFPSFDPSVHFVNPPIPGLYSISEYGIEFEYPKEYLISPYPVSYPAMVNVKAKDTPEYQWLFRMSVDISLPGYDPEKGSNYPWPLTNTFKDVAEFVAKQWCLADGPSGAILCDKVISITPFATKAGIQGYELYLRQITRDYSESKIVAEKIRGPIFVLDTKVATNGRLIDVWWELAEFAYTQNTEQYTKILRDIVSSLKTIEN